MPKLFIFSFFVCLLPTRSQTKTWLFVGNYTAGTPSASIYVFDFNSTTGRLKELSHLENIINPSFITVAPGGKCLYACTETKMDREGAVSAFIIDTVSGKLHFLNKQACGGNNPVYLEAYPDGRFVVNANYDQGSVSVFRTNQDGSLKPFSQLMSFSDSSINKSRQDRSHIHATVFSPDFQTVYCPDLGADKIRAFTIDGKMDQPLVPANNLLTNTVPGSGPRHFVFHPKNKFAYAVEELSGMVAAYLYKDGKLDSIQRSFAYSKIQSSYGSADIHISPDGLFLYCSNRWEGENTIAIFSINQENGRLTLKGHQSTYGDHPRNFVIDPAGEFLVVANQVSNSLVIFKRNKTTGLLNRIGEDIKVQMPSCLKMYQYKFN